MWEEVERSCLTDSEDSIDLCELISLKVEIFLHSRYISIGEVATIQLSTYQQRLDITERGTLT
jgi:hypothetical protein